MAKTTNNINEIILRWWAVTDSNRRHPACKAGALPTELTALVRDLYRRRARRGKHSMRKTVAPGAAGRR